MTDKATETAWHWYAGKNDEWYTVGPCATRDEALAEAIDEDLGAYMDDHGMPRLSIHLIEARRDPVRLTHYAEIDEFLDRANDIASDSNLSGECSDIPIFEVSEAQASDLRDRLRRTCDEWQAAHSLTFHPHVFIATRSHEIVDVTAPPQPRP